MTKDKEDQLDRQLVEIQHLIVEIDAISARLKRAADAAMSTRTMKKEAGNDEPV